MTRGTRLIGGLVVLGCAVVTLTCIPPSRNNVDEATKAGLKPDYFKPAADPYFKDMDGGIALTPQEEAGRNMWIVWTGGNDHFWDTIGKRSVGTLDFLKTISSYKPNRDPKAASADQGYYKQRYKYGRHNRWGYLGLVNEPCFKEPDGPDPNRWGLWLDQRVAGPGCPPDPFEDEQKYPGVKIGARGKDLLGKKNPAGSYYGWATGIVGLRLFPNPDFDEAAARKWDATRFYTDPSYYNQADLVRPYRVGMSCGFCHVGPNPVKPPEDPENPKWENLSSNVGAQYFWVDRIFAWESDPSSFFFQLFHTARPGTLDTSLVSSDNINNPRTMNSVYQLGARLKLAKALHPETLGPGSRDNKQFNDFVPPDSPLAQFFQKPEKVWTPRVLKDGADSVGALGALNRVYINIGLFSEEWLQHFNPLVGGKRITPIPIATARTNSAFWGATEAQTPNMALFFLKATAPHHLADVKGGIPPEGKPDNSKLAEGRRVFAERCARCHSSKLPELPQDKNPGRAECEGAGYPGCFAAYWGYTKTPEFKTAMKRIVDAPDFLQDNFLSTDLRIPVTLLGTNACSPVASNAIRGNIWDNFSSETYKNLPSLGEIEYRQPFTGEKRTWKLPGGGRGFTRPATLVSIWSSAPYLLNNTVGKMSDDEDPRMRYGYTPSPSVKNRLWAFQDGMTKLLWPEKRERDSMLGDKGVFLIDRTTHTSYLRVPAGYVPDFLRNLLAFIPNRIFNQNGIELGPIPKGTPVTLISNLQLLAETIDTTPEHSRQLLDLLITLKHDLRELPDNPTDADAARGFANATEKMIALSTCPDYEVNKGHYFGTSYFPEEPGLSDNEKFALIEFLKTF